MNKVMLIAIVGLLISCSRSDAPPAKETVRTRINRNYASFARTLDFDIGRTGIKCFFPFSGEQHEEPMDIGYRPESDAQTIVAVGAGLITVKPVDKDHWDVSLTDKAKLMMDAELIERKHHRVGNGCDEYDVAFPIATAYVTAISDPANEAGTYLFPYAWQWKITEVGQALREDGAIYSKLTPKQRADLDKNMNISFGSGFESVPVLPFPVPSAADNASNWGTAIFKKKGSDWEFNLRK